jgi:hypothetical protein
MAEEVLLLDTQPFFCENVSASLLKATKNMTAYAMNRFTSSHLKIAESVGIMGA